MTRRFRRSGMSSSKASVLVPPGRRDDNDGISRRRSTRPANRHDRTTTLSRRTRTLLSFQGPMPGRAGNEKASAHARGLLIERATKKVVSESSEGAPVSRRAFLAYLSGGRGSLPAARGVSRCRNEACKTALAGLEHAPLGVGTRDVERADRSTVDLHPALGDHPTCLARREVEGTGDHGGQV